MMKGATFHLSIDFMMCREGHSTKIKNPRELRKIRNWPSCDSFRGGTLERGTEKPLPRRNHRGKRRPGERVRCVRRRQARGSQPCPSPAVTPSLLALVPKSVGGRKLRRASAQQYKSIDRIFDAEDRIYAKIVGLERKLKTTRDRNPGIRALVRRLRDQGEILREIHRYQTKVLNRPSLTEHMQPDGHVVKFKSTGRNEGRFTEEERRDGEGHCPICSYLTLEVEKHLRKKHAAKGRAMADAMFGAVSSVSPSPVGGKQQQEGPVPGKRGGPLRRRGVVKGGKRFS